MYVFPQDLDKSKMIRVMVTKFGTHGVLVWSGLGLILGLDGQRSKVTRLKSGSERPSVPVASPRFFDIRQMARPSSVNAVNIAVQQSSVITQLVMSV